MKNLSFIIITFCVFTSCQAQTQKEIELINNFIKDLFEQNISAKRVIRDYIQILPDSKNKLSISERINGAEEFVEMIRKGDKKENNWLIPNYAIEHIKKPKICTYSECKDLNDIEINGIDNVRNRVYVLLSKDRNEILQYFLLNKDKDKIQSFSLFIKGSKASFFVF
tara:strand:- start:23 stop:523 length:501 start_codon:yes stop_codon:yes gene_type:complete